MRQMQTVMSKRRDKTDYPALQYAWQNDLVGRLCDIGFYENKRG
jgi:hypothetical protein